MLESIGGGNRTQANISDAAGRFGSPLPSGVLSPLLRRLDTEKRVIKADEPLSTQSGKPALYRIADSNLRFYFVAGREAAEEISRGRPQVALDLVKRRWASWRGRAIEPLIREALERAATVESSPWPGVTAVGGWWNRQFNPEIDLVGADRSGVAEEIGFVGSIKWLNSAFDGRDATDLVRNAPKVPGFSAEKTGLVVVSRSGISADARASLIGHAHAVVWGPDDVLAAWDQ